MPRALFIDRDGVLNDVVFREGDIHSPRTWEETKLCPGLEKLPELKALGYELIMVTNQPDIERLVVDPKFVEEFHGYLQKTYQLDAIYCCPFKSEDHPNKKPNPGMFLDAAKDRNLSLKDCYHLGDTSRDVEGARRCGAKSILWSRSYNQDVTGFDFKIQSFEELQKILLEGAH